MSTEWIDPLTLGPDERAATIDARYAAASRLRGLATGPRTWLAEAQERAEKDQACYRCRLTKREHQMGYAASRCTFTTSPPADPDKTAMAVALTAVLDLHQPVLRTNGYRCSTCVGAAACSGSVYIPYPCPTVSKIQEALNVSA